ncbi:MAG: sugar phosphate isomerase/epimerase [Acidobacteria bacterium]|nr:sugar phosphate isomerase/epimerase [Acidobacteriota bacterium]
MIKTSFSTLACPDWDLQQILSAARDYGYDGVELRVVSRELDLWNLPAFKPSSIAATRASVEDRGLVVAAIGSSACFHSADSAERERNLDSALRIAEIAAGLKAPAVRVFGDRIQPGSTRLQAMHWIAESLAGLSSRLAGSGVQVWLETHGDFASAEEVAALFALIDDTAVGIIWDPANAFAQMGEAPRLPPTLVSRVRHVHVKDLRRDGPDSFRYALTGDGEFPFGTMFGELTAARFDGFVSFEWEKHWHPELVAPEIALPHFMRWWKSREMA